MKPHDSDSLQALIEAYVTGELTPEEMKVLNARLRAGEDERLFFLAYMEVHAGLAWKFRGAGMSVSELAEKDVLITRVDTPFQTQPSTTARPRFSPKRWIFWVAPVAAAVMLAVMAGLWPQGGRDAVPSPAIAKVRATLHGQWGDGREVVVGTSLQAGLCDLQSGLVELETASGAVLLVEAPVSFELLDVLRARLLAGSMVVRMKKGSSGFVVEMPHMRVTDLGTEFGARVGLHGDSQVQVFDGKVQAQSKTGESGKELKAGEALTSDESGGLSALAFRDDRFLRRFPPATPETQTGGVLYNHSKLETVSVPAAPAGVQIDADFSDWNTSGAFVATCDPPYDRAYFLTGMMMYDSENLYLAAHVGDPEPMQNRGLEEREFAGGSVIVRVSTDRTLGWPLKNLGTDSRGRPESKPEAKSGRLATIVMWYDAAAGVPRLRLNYGFDFHAGKTLPLDWRGAFRKDPDGHGYKLEYAIPWSLLNCGNDPPRPGDAMAAVWTVHWSDEGGRICRGNLVEITNHGATGTPQYEFKHGPCWGRAIYLPEGLPGTGGFVIP